MTARNLAMVLLMLVCCCVFNSSAQDRKITPVEVDDGKPEQPRLHYYDRHGNKLQEPVLFLAELDTVSKSTAKPVWPLLSAVSVGFNFFDGVMWAAGQRHASFDVWADVSLWNWFMPVVEAGIGYADSSPEGANFRYRGKPSFYCKLGVNYNVLYKSDRDYQVFAGFRVGFSRFSYDLEDVTVSSGYWDQTEHISITGQRATAIYGQILLGVKVKIWKGLAMGWTGRYGLKFHTTQGTNSDPWFIPGYGTKSPLSVTFSLIYTIPFGKKKAEIPTAISGDL